MQENEPTAIYEEQLRTLETLEKKLLSNKTRLAWLRFFAIVIAFILLWQLWSVNIPLAFAAFIVFIGVFIFVVKKDLTNRDAIANTRLLQTINRQEISIGQHLYTDLPDGATLKPTNHSYANDLDIFGKASLYQYINRTSSEQGNDLLAAWLLNPTDSSTIIQRQQAAKELAPQLEWRLQLRAYGIINPVTNSAEAKMKTWLQKENKFSSSGLWTMIRFVYPLVAVTALILFIVGVIPPSLFSLLFVIFLAIAFGISKFTMENYLLLDKIVPSLETLEKSISWIEKKSFESELLMLIKNKLQSKQLPASSYIQRLKNILERLDIRFNPIVYIPLNTFLLWDLQQIFALEKWKKNHNEEIIEWFNALAATETLSTLGTLTFNHPNWCFPVISKNDGVFIAEELGHPLIPPGKRVDNSFTTSGEKQINLITGSNMAGKSTFLRSVGVNIVMAMMGAPVCSKQLTVSNLKVISTMRVSDNLEENTSTFYAELKKLKEIIEAVNRKEKVFLLLDEILRGTNSADRHTGSKALIRQLIKENACGMIATHDLELANLATEYPDNLHNYHFDVQVQQEELFFDYKIKKGICTSMNASLLMKKIGIDL